jgi:transposase/transglutaminase-like putative cysteine protease
VFIDETWASTNMARRYGRAPRGRRLRMSVPHRHCKTITFIAGLRNTGMVAPFVIDGPANREFFELYVEKVLVPELEPGDIVVMDNPSSHKGPAVRAMIRAAGARLLYLPPYSPDFNPIEKAFAKLKAALRKAAQRTVDELWDTIGRLVDAFTPQGVRQLLHRLWLPCGLIGFCSKRAIRAFDCSINMSCDVYYSILDHDPSARQRMARNHAPVGEGLMDQFLRVTEIIDWTHPAVFWKAKELAKNATDIHEIVRRCFEWVRDSIQHSADFQRNPVTCSASQVLASGTGYCYAKSHLLAALLRANRIPVGFSYQRLSIDETGAPYCLHGLNAVHLPECGWYRVDSRGNKPGVNAQFSPPAEQLAFRPSFSQERDFLEVLPDPLPVVVTALRKYSTWDALFNNLPDWDSLSLPGSPLKWRAQAESPS